MEGVCQEVQKKHTASVSWSSGRGGSAPLGIMPGPNTSHKQEQLPNAGRRMHPGLLPPCRSAPHQAGPEESFSSWLCQPRRNVISR